MNLHQYIESLGNLHDSEIEKLCYDPIKAELILRINDLYANFADTDMYIEGKNAEFCFLGVTGLKFEVENSFNIYDFTVSLDCKNIKIQLWPAGILEFICDNNNWSEIPSTGSRPLS